MVSSYCMAILEGNLDNVADKKQGDFKYHCSEIIDYRYIVEMPR